MKFIINLLRAGRRLHDLFWDMRLNINTRGRIEQRDYPSFQRDSNAVDSSAYNILNKIFKKITIQKTDILADYGCGKGRVVCVASRLPFKKVYGIELHPDVAEVAKLNSEKVRKRQESIEIIVKNVLEFDCANVTVFFFFNPFGEKTMREVLNLIHTSLLKNPRHIQIIYFNPEQAPLLDGCNWLIKREELCHTRRGKHIVEFYENKMALEVLSGALN